MTDLDLLRELETAPGPFDTDCAASRMAREALPALISELEAARAAIQATLELADDLNEMAEQGAGFHPHWGERVLQAAEPLRNVGKFKDQTLEHNKMLLESNSAFLKERDKARAELAEEKAAHQATREALQVAIDEDNAARAEAARLRRIALYNLTRLALLDVVQLREYECLRRESVMAIVDGFRAALAQPKEGK